MPICKFCGEPFTWGNQDGAWVPLVPKGDEADLKRDYQDEDGALRSGHRQICKSFGPSVKVVKLAKAIEAREMFPAQSIAQPPPTQEVKEVAQPFTLFPKKKRAPRAKKSKGFTLIELLLVFAILAILVAIFLPAYITYQKTGELSTGNLSWGITGMTETRCIDGYKFVVGEGGQARQIMDSAGRGVPCK